MVIKLEIPTLKVLSAEFLAYSVHQKFERKLFQVYCSGNSMEKEIFKEPRFYYHYKYFGQLRFLSNANRLIENYSRRECQYFVAD